MNWYQELQFRRDEDIEKERQKREREEERRKLKQKDREEKIHDRRKEVLKYICITLGAARDYRYLVLENKNVMDNEVTSLYPLSYPKISFILYMVSKADPYLHDLLSFSKNRKYGVHSEILEQVFDSVLDKYKNTKRTRTLNFASREFVHLAMPASFSLTDVPALEKVDNKRNWCYHLFVNGDTKMLRHMNYPSHLKPKNMLFLESVFKEDVLLYMPVYYYNYYSAFNALKGVYVSRTDKRKEFFKLNLSDDGRKRLLENKALFYRRLGSNDDIKLKYKVQKETDDDKELHEFFLKSILVRRSPYSRINTRLNNTNGIYLLHKGVAIFREAVYSDILKKREIQDIFYIDFKERNIFIDKKVRKRTDFYDFNSPYLLKDNIIKTIDYKYTGLHRLIKYIQAYAHLAYSDRACYYILGKYLKDDTGFSGTIKKIKREQTFRAYECIPECNLKKLSRIFYNGSQT